jgi:HK97 family phage major capsid protein/HK97 family phage prohead protease
MNQPMKRAYAVLEIKSATDGTGVKRTFRGIASTPTPDRSADIVVPKGAKFKMPLPLLWQHDSGDPIGWITRAKVTDKGIEVEGEVAEIADDGPLKQRLATAWQYLKSGLVRGLSIGFNPIKYSFIEATGGIQFDEWEWLELSGVTIAANQEATITTIKSIDTQQLAALGHNKPPPVDRPSPGASGHTSGASSGALSHSRSQKGKDTMTLQELLATRETKNARIKELMDLRTAEGDRKFTPEEAAEFDGLTDDVGNLDDDIRVAKYHATNSKDAKPVDTKRFSGAGAGGMSFAKKEDPDDKFKGQAFTRTLIAKALAFMEMRQGNFVTPAQIAEARWGKSHPKLVQYIKAAVAGHGTSSGEAGAELTQADTRFTGDFIEFLYGATIYDRLPLRAVPGRVHIKGQDGAATGYWVGESKGIPVSKADYSDVELSPLKVAAMAVCSKEWVRDASPSAEMLIRDAIVQASSQRVDSTFLSATAASAGVSPAGLLNGVTAVTNSGGDADALRSDFQELVAPFITNKNSTGLQIVTTPSLAMAIGMLVNALGQPEFPGLSENGGTLFNKPVTTGDNVGPGDLILLKPSDIWKIDDRGFEVSMTDQATIEQDSAPQGASDTPVAASATLMSLWQTESIGFKVVRSINFQKRRSHAVQFIGNAGYGVAAGLSTE